MNCSPVLPADEGLRLESDEIDEYDHWFRGKEKEGGLPSRSLFGRRSQSQGAALAIEQINCVVCLTKPLLRDRGVFVREIEI